MRPADSPPCNCAERQGHYNRLTASAQEASSHFEADALKKHVASGAYASESEVIRDEFRAEPSTAMSAGDMRAHLASLHEQRASENDK